MSDDRAQKEIADELEILSPDLDLQVGGKAITVRELTYFERLRLAPATRPLIRSIAEAMAEQGEATPAALFKAIEDNAELFIRIACMVTGLDEAGFDALTEGEGEQLITAVYIVNRDFFGSRIGRAVYLLSKAKSSDPAI